MPFTHKEERIEQAWFQSKWDALTTCEYCPGAHPVSELLALAVELLARYEGTDELAEAKARSATRRDMG